VDAVIDRPEHPYTASLLAAVPRIGERRLLSDWSVETATATGEAPPPGGCDYRLRCPIGPAADPSRDICAEADPATEAAVRAHRAACHFARAAAPAP
jgi:peptide/nickel transport system ATP-binding protein